MLNDFSQLEKVFRREKPDRPVLFEFFLNERLYRNLSGPAGLVEDKFSDARCRIVSYANMGYDYVLSHVSSLRFKRGDVHRGEDHKTYSLNAGNLITCREDFENYIWPDPDSFSDEMAQYIFSAMPQRMKLIAMGPGGVLENMLALTGYDNLCYLLYEDRQLVADLANKVGACLYRYYERVMSHPRVGALMSNDDWGFNTQTMISPADLRKFVFPWHEAFAQLAHRNGKAALLHSCGYAEEIMEDVIAMGFDARHSYEDNIMPVEDFYEKYHKRIAILGGMDLNFVCTAKPAEVAARSAAMLERTRDRGAYALGTGNSVPYYVPDENYLAMVSATGLSTTQKFPII